MLLLALASPQLALWPWSTTALPSDGPEHSWRDGVGSRTRQHYRTWQRCVFQSIRSNPIDQFLFHLLGGRLLPSDVELSGARECDMWSHPGRARQCPCAAPTQMLGNGTFVEIGANDGLHMSNTWFFDNYLGWRGMCVEANMRVYRRLLTHRPRCLNVNALVGSFGGDEDPAAGAGAPRSLPFVSFYRAGGIEKVQSKRDWETGLSGVLSATSAKSVLRSVDAATAFAREKGVRVERAMLPVQRFDALFRKHGFETIDMLSVDVEGSEHAVLSTIDFGAVYIRYIVTERADANVTGLLRASGFRDGGVQFELGDAIFVNRREAHVPRVPAWLCARVRHLGGAQGGGLCRDRRAASKEGSGGQPLERPLSFDQLPSHVGAAEDARRAWR